MNLEPSSLLATITGATTIGINSLHHQAVGAVGAGMRAVAWSPDGVIEAIESATLSQLGVQWHPELLTDRPAMANIFGWLVSTATVSAGAAMLDAVA